MKTKTYQLFAVGIVALAMSNFPVRAAYVDITVNDGSPNANYGADPRAGINESGETEANCVSNASWDLRAIAFDVNTNKLMVVSGFNPLSQIDNIGIGDIFIDTNNSFVVPNRPVASNGFYNYSNSSVGYEYAIDLISPSNGGYGYNIVALSGASTMRTGEYNQNALSDPASLVATGADTILASGFFNLTTKTDAQVLADLGINIGTNGGTNYVFTFDLSSASLSNGATFRLTQECGNDLLVGHLAAGVAAVPETSTWVMGFLALGAVGFMVRRNAKLTA
ncbi:MAG: PEP-CTERM sorting domain-containing protein [Verrucomicrobiota bacterium]